MANAIARRSAGSSSRGELACIRYSNRRGARMLFTTELLAEFLQQRAQRSVQVEFAPAAPVHRMTRPAKSRSPREDGALTREQLF